MKVDLKNTLNKTLEVLIPRHNENMLGKALLVSIRVSYMTSFDSLGDKDLTKVQLKTIQNLIGDLPISILDDRYIDCDINHQLLFLNRGHYVCFYNDDNLWVNEKVSKWKLQSNHDTCWRDGAYRDLEKKDQAIRTTMAIIKETIDKRMCAPINIISNFSKYNCLEVIDLPIYKGSRGYRYSDRSELTLTLSSEGNSLIADDRKDEMDML